MANIGIDSLCFGGSPITSVHLAGPGTGTVVLAQVDVQQCSEAPFTDAPFADAPFADAPFADAPFAEAPFSEAPFMGELLTGGGFSELHIHDSTLISSNTGLSGSGIGAGAISVTVPYLLLSGSTVHGNHDDIDICTSAGFFGLQIPHVAYPAVSAPTSQVVVLDSEIRGGSFSLFCCTLCSCPADLSTVASSGGAGIVAAEVIVAGSSVAGGFGAANLADGVPCGSTPSGAADLTRASRACRAPSAARARSRPEPSGL